MPKLIDTVATKRTASTMNWDGRSDALSANLYLEDDDPNKTKVRVYTIKTEPAEKDVNGSPQSTVTLSVSPDSRTGQPEEVIDSSTNGSQFVDKMVERMKAIAQRDHDQIIASHNDAYAQSHPKKAYKQALKNIGDSSRWHADRILLRADVGVGSLPPVGEVKSEAPRPAENAMKPVAPTGAVPGADAPSGGTGPNSNRGPAMGEMMSDQDGMGNSMPKDAQAEAPPPTGGVPEGLEGAQPPPPDAAPTPGEEPEVDPQGDPEPEKPLDELILGLEKDIADLKKQVLEKGNAFADGNTIEPVKTEADEVSPGIAPQNQSPAGATGVGTAGPPGGVPKGAALPDDAPSGDGQPTNDPAVEIQQLIAVYETLYNENKELETKIKDNKDVIGAALDALEPLLASLPAQTAFYRDRLVQLQKTDASIVPWKQVNDEFRLAGQLSIAQEQLLDSIIEKLTSISKRRKLKFTEPTKKTSDVVEQGQSLGMEDVGLVKSVNSVIDAFTALKSCVSGETGEGFAMGASNRYDNLLNDVMEMHPVSKMDFQDLVEHIKLFADDYEADGIESVDELIKALKDTWEYKSSGRSPGKDLKDKQDQEKETILPNTDDFDTFKSEVNGKDAAAGHSIKRMKQLMSQGEEEKKHIPRRTYMTEKTMRWLKKEQDAGRTIAPTTKRDDSITVPHEPPDSSSVHPSRQHYPKRDKPDDGMQKVLDELRRMRGSVVQKTGVDEDAKKYFEEDLYGTDSTKGYGESLVENKVSVSAEDKIAMLITASIEAGITLTDDQIVDAVDALTNGYAVHGAYLRHIASSLPETRDGLMDRVFELAQTMPELEHGLCRVMANHLVKSSSLLNNIQDIDRRAILDDALQVNPVLASKLKQLCDRAASTEVNPTSPLGGPEMITAALEITAAAMPKMTTPKVRKGEDDAVDVIKLEDAAKDYEGPTPGTTDFKVVKKTFNATGKDGQGYLKLKVEWDPDQITRGDIKLGLKRFLQNYVSHRYPVDHGYTYTAVVKDIDSKKGTATCQLAASRPGDATLEVTSKSKSK